MQDQWHAIEGLLGMDSMQARCMFLDKVKFNVLLQPYETPKMLKSAYTSQLQR